MGYNDYFDCISKSALPRSKKASDCLYNKDVFRFKNIEYFHPVIEINKSTVPECVYLSILRSLTVLTAGRRGWGVTTRRVPSDNKATVIMSYTILR